MCSVFASSSWMPMMSAALLSQPSLPITGRAASSVFVRW
jgi:hypothetical protein